MATTVVGTLTSHKLHIKGSMHVYHLSQFRFEVNSDFFADVSKLILDLGCQ
jgi:hypothetical protein